MIQSAELLPSTSTMMKELGWKDTYTYLRYKDLTDLKLNYAMNRSLRRFLDAKNLLDDRNEDVVIYLTTAVPSGWGIYSTTFIFYQ